MIPKERFLAAVRREAVDRVPLFDFLFQRPLYTELISRTPVHYNAKDAMALSKKLNLDGVWIPYGCFSGWAPEKISDTVYIDEWGTTFEQNDASWPIDAPIDYPLKHREKLSSFTLPDPLAPGRLSQIEDAIAINTTLKDEAIAVFGGVGGPLTISWMLIGYEDICMNLFDDRDFLATVAQYACDFALPGIALMAKAGVDGMIISEDLGSSTGGLISPDDFRQIYKPKLKMMIDCAHDNHLPVLLHSCGHIYDYLDDLISLGIDALHPLQRTAQMDLSKVKKEYGKSICLVGNIDSSGTLPYGTLADVEKETREAIDTAAPGYGFILASDHSLHDGIPIENIEKMFSVAAEYGIYPIGE